MHRDTRMAHLTLQHPTWASARAHHNGRQFAYNNSRTIGHCTYVRRTADTHVTTYDIYVFGTLVMRIGEDNCATFRVGGRYTPVSRDRLDQLLPAGMYVSGPARQWNLYGPKLPPEGVPFADGILIDLGTGEVVENPGLAAEVKRRETHALIDRYVRGITLPRLLRARAGKGDKPHCSVRRAVVERRYTTALLRQFVDDLWGWNGSIPERAYTQPYLASLRACARRSLRRTLLTG